MQGVIGAFSELDSAVHAIEDQALFIFARVADNDLQHESIHLRFRQRISAFLFDWILRRQNQEWFGKLKSLIADRDLVFLHRFEQRTLDFAWGAIDFCHWSAVPFFPRY